ncbi:MAG: glutathione S-transferase family protein [Maricaulaceae bacterium]|nr:glutathione S-transferase family protein [Maricaulaceae bacterium]
MSGGSGLTLYDYGPAPSPRRARWVLAEKGVAYDRVEVDLAKGEQMAGAYRAINPRCTVPALKLPDGAVLTDNAAIVRWLEEMRPDPPLLGRDPMEKALCAEWIARVEAEGLMAVAEVLRNTSKFFANRGLPGPEDHAQIPALAERGRARAAAFFKTLDARLAQADYLAGDVFSAADIAAFVFIDFAAWVKLAPGPELTALAAWRAAVGERPGAAA